MATAEYGCLRSGQSMLMSRTLMVVLLSRSKVKVSPSAMLITLPWMVSCSFVVVGRQAVELSRRKRRQNRNVIVSGGEV